jgi:hypothetical protein
MRTGEMLRQAQHDIWALPGRLANRWTLLKADSATARDRSSGVWIPRNGTKTIRSASPTVSASIVHWSNLTIPGHHQIPGC